MKHTHLFLLAVIALAACNQIEPKKPIDNAKVDFTIKTNEKAPLVVSVANQSTTGLTVYKWEWGDGTDLVVWPSSHEQTVHTYDHAGTYDITLTCRDKNSFQYSATKSVTVGQSGENTGDDPKDNPQDDPKDDPTLGASKVYLSGYKIYSMEGNPKNFYTQLEVSMLMLMGDPKEILTSPQLMYNYLLPFTFNITPVLIGDLPNPFDYYTDIMVTLYCSESKISQSGDIAILKWFDDPSVFDGKTEYIIQHGDSKIGLIFTYK